jgi:hypothetical protein
LAGRAAEAETGAAALLPAGTAFDLAALRTGAFSAAVRFGINLGFADLPLKVRFLVEDFAEDAELLLLRKLGRDEDALFKPFTTGSLMGASTFKGGSIASTDDVLQFASSARTCYHRRGAKSRCACSLRKLRGKSQVIVKPMIT